MSFLKPSRAVLSWSALTFALALAMPAAAGDSPTTKHAGSRDLKPIAENVAVQVAQVKPGQLVLVSGDVRTMPLLQELAIAVARQGASPLITASVEKDGLRFWTEVAESHDVARMAWNEKLAGAVDVILSVDSTEHPGLLREIPAARLAAASKAGLTASQLMRSRKVVNVSIGNGLYPTDATAKELGLSRAELETVFWSALAVPAADLARDGEAVKSAFAAGKQVRVTGANGTDLTFSVEGRRPIVSNGIVTAHTREQNEIATWLPAGEVYVTPVRGSARGKLVVDRQPYSGGVIEQLTFTFEAGKVTAHTARPSAAYERFKQQWDAAPAGKDELSLIDIGVNRGAMVPKGKTIPSYIPAGNVTLGLGGNLWAGGEIEVAYGVMASMALLTVTVDGKTLVEKGVLKTTAGTM